VVLTKLLEVQAAAPEPLAVAAREDARDRLLRSEREIADLKLDPDQLVEIGVD
jgi:hypothetical protein